MTEPAAAPAQGAEAAPHMVNSAGNIIPNRSAKTAASSTGGSAAAAAPGGSADQGDGKGLELPPGPGQEPEDLEEETGAEDAGAGEEAAEKGEGAAGDAAAAGEEGKPSPAAPPPDTLEVEMEFQGEKLRVPLGKLKAVALEAEGKVEEANAVLEEVERERKDWKEFSDEMREDFTLSAYRVLLDKHGGDEDKAWKELVGRAKAIVERDEAWNGMSETERQGLLARRDADRYRTENERLKKEREAEAENEKHADVLEKFLGVARPALEAVGLLASEPALRRIQEIFVHNVKLGRRPTVEACAKLLKSELERARTGLQKDAVASWDPLEFIKAHPEFAKKLTEASIRLAKARTVRSGAAGGAPANGAAAAPGNAAPPARKPAGGPQAPIVVSPGLSTGRFFETVAAEVRKRRKT